MQTRTVYIVRFPNWTKGFDSRKIIKLRCFFKMLWFGQLLCISLYNFIPKKFNTFCMWPCFRMQQLTFGLNSTKQSTWSIMQSVTAVSSCLIPVWLILQLVPSVHDQYISIAKLIHVMHSHSWFVVYCQSVMHLRLSLKKGAKVPSRS